MADQTPCPRCGTLRPAPLLQGLCPECLLKMALEGPGAAAASGGIEPTVSFAAGASSEEPPRVTPLPEIGQQFGDYRVVRRLGHGGMGVVYEADHLPSGRRVALKVLSRALDSPEARRRFLREGRLAASVNHPNSVYIFGTEEIDGSPVIAMELVPGGTLQTRVKQHGPLPVAEAVDAALEMIAGLEAAQAVGVLHRDVKPGNCFVDTDGRVKIGDFGLSISTSGRDESFLTAAGSILGTPAFSSPEQLRGDELNVRSDIYSVGATLYWLLTGRTPFEADNLVKLLATVLEQPAPSPQQWRREIPAQLARVVLRCLEKQPAKRFHTYEELRQALFPFGSTAPTPAALRSRFLAGLVDLCIAGLPSCMFAIVFNDGPLEYLAQERSLRAVVAYALAGAWMLAYFALPEGVWGASLGKAISGLRVVRPDRNVSGLGRALVRAAIFTMLPDVPGLIQMLFVSAEQSRAMSARAEFSPADWASLLMIGILFATMRRRNGWAALHDWISNTRVVVPSAHVARPNLAPAGEAAVSAAGTAKVGPYDVLDRLPTPEGETILLGYDARLLRKVWIRQALAGTPPVPAELRNLARPGRLRWLNGNRSADSSWDAYEAPSGKPLVNLLQSPQPWAAVRFWLLDLAEEFHAGLRERALPEVLSLDRVWITADGHAKVLDFPAPGSDGRDAGSSPPAGKDFETARSFLHRVALCALEGRTIDTQRATEHCPAVPLPLHARGFLQELPSWPGPELPVDRLRELVQKPATVSRRRRLATVATCPLFYALLVAVIGGHFTLSAWLWDRQWSAEHPDLPSLRLVVKALDWSETVLSDDQDALQIYLVGHFGAIIADPDFWDRADVDDAFPPDSAKIAQRALAAHPRASAEELRKASPAAEAEIAEFRRGQTLSRIGEAVLCTVVVLILCAAFGLLTTLLLGRGIQMWLADVVIVNRRGEKASRLRALWRHVLGAAPLCVCGMLLLFPLFFPGGLPHLLDQLGPVGSWLLAGMIPGLPALFLVGVVWSVWSPERGLQDRLAGTRLVRG